MSIAARVFKAHVEGDLKFHSGPYTVHLDEQGVFRVTNKAEIIYYSTKDQTTAMDYSELANEAFARYLMTRP